MFTDRLYGLLVTRRAKTCLSQFLLRNARTIHCLFSYQVEEKI